MAESTLTITYPTVQRSVGRYLGWSRDPGDWSADEQQDFADFLSEGMRQWAFPVRADGRTHQWKWMYPNANLSTNPPYSTGTIEIVSGVVTLTSGTWPSWAAEGRLKVESVVYTVDTRDSDTQLTLDDTTVDVTAGATFQLGQAYYDLPDDFLDFRSPLTFRPGESLYFPPIYIQPESKLRMLQQGHEYFFRPLYGALVPKRQSDAALVSQRWQLFLAPTPDSTYQLFYRYQINPEILTENDIYHIGGTPFSESFKLSVLAKAEESLNDGSHDMEQRYLRALEAAIDFDNRHNTPDVLGYNSDPGVYRRKMLNRSYGYDWQLAHYTDINYVPLP